MEDAPWWKKVYDSFFPGNKGIFSNRKDGQLQRYGIDRTVVLSSGKAVYVDEKVRREDYGDIALEYVANDTCGALGWVEKPLYCDWIAYAIEPSCICYMLPVHPLQVAWQQNKSIWLQSYRTISARNRNYNTLSCCVPVDVLFSAIGNSHRVRWTQELNMEFPF